MPLKKQKLLRLLIWGVIICVAGWIGYSFLQAHQYQQIIARLQAESRAAEVLVTSVNYDEASQRNLTTIKFLEYDTKGEAMEPKYFTFSGNVVQFQSLVVRFDDQFVASGDAFKGKSVYLFWKAFTLDGARTEEFPITVVNQIPSGYKIEGRPKMFERRFWNQFWSFAFDAQMAKKAGIKSVQIEAPGAMFVPGYVYTITIEHDGGLRIDTKPLPAIVRGEKIPS